jgi:hypothetical protein
MKTTTTMLATAALLLTATACGGAIERDDAAPENTTQHADRFVGDWSVTFTTNRDSSADFTLAPSGAIELLRGGNGTPFQAIAIEPGSKLQCAVGTRWHSAGSSVLVFEAATCSDGVARDVNIAFPADASGNSSYDLRVEVASVGGDTGWRATDFNGPWTIRRCTRAGCR